MQHAKKLQLIDPEVLAAQTNSSTSNSVSLRPSTTVVSKVLDGLDKDIQDTLNSDLPVDIKAKLYLDSLQKYRTIEHNRSHPQKVEEPKIKNLKEELLESFPDNQRHLAKEIYRKLKDNKDVEFSASGELIYKQRLISGSHIIDLIKDVLKKNNEDPPTGWIEFADSLKESNIPKALILNTPRWQQMHPELYAKSGKRKAKSSGGASTKHASEKSAARSIASMWKKRYL